MLCPKCHRPLEDDNEEAYVCCAAAQIEWSCGACGKVSEGFAFPYGACPACGGKLHLRNAPTVTEDAELEAIRTAFAIELGGRAFYTRAAAESPDPELQDLFGKFAAMEAEHLATLARRYHITASVPPSDFPVVRAAIYAGVENHPEDPINLFRIACAFEERAVQFFTERVATAPANAARLYRELAAEEREHVALLNTELERYRQGKPGVL